MKNKFIRKVVVYLVSILVVGGLVGGGLAWKEAKEQAELEATYAEAKPAMTQDEMEALYKEHKKDMETEESEEVLEEETSKEDSDGEDSLENNIVNDSSAEGSDTVQAAGEEAAAETGNSVYEGCPVDFAGMWKTNKDVYAWITVPGTVIDYPILQHPTDNTYYLNYNIDGSHGYPGCIYTENLNSKEFTDNNTVIYGHNMKNGTMFAGLHKFEDSTFFAEHTKVHIYTPEKELNYTIFAAYIYDDRHLLYSFDFSNKDIYAAYLEDVQNMRSMNALIREDVKVTAEDKIITLVTCIGNQPSKRLLVQAVLED